MFVQVRLMGHKRPSADLRLTGYTYFGLVTVPAMREMSVAEQRYKAVLAVIGDGRTATEVARDWGVSRKTLHAWLARYEVAGLE